MSFGGRASWSVGTKGSLVGGGYELDREEGEAWSSASRGERQGTAGNQRVPGGRRTTRGLTGSEGAACSGGRGSCAGENSASGSKIFSVSTIFGSKGTSSVSGSGTSLLETVVRAEPARIEDLGSIPRDVGWKIKEVGDGSYDCSDLAGTGEARGKNMAVTCSGPAAF